MSYLTGLFSYDSLVPKQSDQSETSTPREKNPFPIISKPLQAAGMWRNMVINSQRCILFDLTDGTLCESIFVLSKIKGLSVV